MRTVGLGVSENNTCDEKNLLERIAELEKENAELKKKVTSLEKKLKTTAKNKEVVELVQDADHGKE